MPHQRRAWLGGSLVERFMQQSHMSRRIDRRARAANRNHGRNAIPVRPLGEPEPEPEPEVEPEPEPESEEEVGVEAEVG
jgi:hypothetical protein